MPESGNVLVGIRMKKTAKIDVKGPITAYIKRVYGDRMANDAAESLDELQELRNQIYGAGAFVVGVGMDEFSKYYSALRAIEIRFPVSSENSHVNINFRWHDAFRDNMTCAQRNIHFEQAAVVFCMAAISSQKGVDINRKSEQGITDVVKSFAMAAGLLKYLRENLVIKTGHQRTVDITGECCTMLEALMLAQSQEMCYELMHAKRSSNPQRFTHTILAQVAKSCADMYGDVASRYSNPTLVKHFDKEWAETSRVKHYLYLAEADYMQAQHLQPLAGAKFGEYLGHLRRAAATLHGKHKEVKLSGAELQKQFKDLEVKVDKQLEEAEREQQNIYMQLVPADLPEVAAKQMARPHDPAELLNSPQEWFSQIVPDTVTRHLSRYTADMEEIVRGLLTKLEGATDDARTALVQHNLPYVLEAMNPGNPPELPEKAYIALQDDFVARGPAAQLRRLVADLTGLKEQAASSLRDCTTMLDEEERTDNALRQQWGEQWSRPHSNVLASPLRDTIARYQSNLATAAESDMRTMQRLDANRTRLESLSMDNARSRLPHLEQPMVSVGAADPATVSNTLRGALVGLEALGSERDVLEDKIKTTKDKDNMLPELLQCGASDVGPIFEAHLKQYELLMRDVEQNLARQAELLDVVSANMSSFRTVFDVVGWQQECNKIADTIVADVKMGNELLNQLSEGVVWYSGMQESIDKLKKMCGDCVLSRDFDREDREKELKKQKDRERANQANEEAARRLAEMDLNTAGATAGHPPPPPATHATHPYPAPPHGPAAPQPSPYSSYPPVPGGDWSQPYPQASSAPQYAALPPQHAPYGAPPPHNPPQQHQQPPQHQHGQPPAHQHQPYGAPPPYGPQADLHPYGSQSYGQHSGYYQSQTYPQGPYSHQPPPGHQ